MGALQRGKKGRAAIIGGSMSGLIAGLMLRRAGWDAVIFERSDEELSGRGAGIVAQPELIDTLGALGLATAELGVRTGLRRMFDRAGRITIERPCEQVLTAWERVYRLLRDAFPAEHYHRDREFVGLEKTPDGVGVRFSDGSRTDADVMIGADGLRSSVRAQFQPQAQPVYASYVGWRALIPEAALPPDIHRDLFDGMAFCLPPGEQMLGYPVAGPNNDLRVGHRRYNMIWYRPADETTHLRRLLTDADGRLHPVSIPPPLIRREEMAIVHDDARRLLAPQFATLFTGVAHPILQPIYDLESPQLAFGRVAIIGDAAFVARPHVGAGVLKAAGDARALADSLMISDDVLAALRAFEAERLPVGRRIVAHARHLGAYLQATRNNAEREASGRHGVPEAVLTETALVDFLRR
jgi:2-polyprenyl-6-methoxyphenol hydroxylase-like FAD-dependent oxidoreductase